VSELLRAFRFDVELLRSQDAAVGAVGTANTSPAGRRLGDGLFQECTGLELEADIKEYTEGGRNDEVIRRVGRVKLQPLVLKRGMFTVGETGRVNGELWRWLQSMVSGERPVARYDGIVSVIHPRGTPVMARWFFHRGLPMRVKGPTLNAETGQVAIEELHIAHEGLVLEVPANGPTG
jgi:phage tail-like protein